MLNCIAVEEYFNGKYEFEVSFNEVQRHLKLGLVEICVESQHEDSFFKALFIALTETPGVDPKPDGLEGCKLEVCGELSCNFESTEITYRSWAQAAANVYSVNIELLFKTTKRLDFTPTAPRPVSSTTVYLSYSKDLLADDGFFSAIVPFSEFHDLCQIKG